MNTDSFHKPLVPSHIRKCSRSWGYTTLNTGLACLVQRLECCKSHLQPTARTQVPVTALPLTPASCPSRLGEATDDGSRIWLPAPQRGDRDRTVHLRLLSGLVPATAGSWRAIQQMQDCCLFLCLFLCQQVLKSKETQFYGIQILANLGYKCATKS